MRSKFKIWGLILAIGFTIAGCQTVKMPGGPNIAQMAIRSGAPVIAISAVDTRTSDKIGRIGATAIKVKTTETKPMVEGYSADLFYDKGLNVTLTPQIDYTRKSSILDAIGMLNANGLVRVELNSLSVSSIDIFLDNPQYEAYVHVIIYDKTGAAIYDHNVRGLIKSRTMSPKKQGVVLGEVFQAALAQLDADPDFSKSIAMISS